MDTASDLTDMDKLKRQRPWILFDQSDLNTEESESEHFNTGRTTSISRDKLLLGAAREAVKSNSNDHPTRSLDSATATGNSRSWVASIMEKENIAGPTIITNTTGSNSTLPPKVPVDLMEGTSDVSSASTSENILLRGRQKRPSPPVKSNVPRKLPNGRPAGNNKASTSSHLASKNQIPREACSQGPILISDDSDG